ncbi:MAG: Bacterial regulatory protein luxR family [Actinomycetota bacterium]
MANSSELAKKLASCRNYAEICQLLSIFPLTNKNFSGALLASLDADGRIRELGRYGIVGQGPSREAVPIASSGLIAKAMQKMSPSVISNLSDHAGARRLTPSSDIDELVEANGFETAFVIPLVDHSYLYGVLGLVSHEPLKELPVFKIEIDTFQALLGMAIRAVAYRNPEQNPQAELTLREQAILSLLAQDKSNQEISTELNISVSTAKAAVSEILRKLGVSSRKQAGIKARYSRLA